MVILGGWLFLMSEVLLYVLGVDTFLLVKLREGGRVQGGVVPDYTHL